MHPVTTFLKHEWMFFVLYGMTACWQAFARRDGARALRETDATNWPTIRGMASCRVWPYGLGRFRLAVRGVPEDGSRPAAWARVFQTKEEADYYARAFAGRTVEVHIDPENAKERLLRWAELREMALPFVSTTGGRLSVKGFAAVRAFRGVAVAAFALSVGDLAAFATPWGRSFEWHTLCICDLSIALLLFGIALLLPAAMLRARMRALPKEDAGALPVFWRKGMVGLTLSALLTILVLLVYGAMVKGDAPDGVWWGVISAPIFPMMWWSLAVATIATRELRPLGPKNGSCRVTEEGVLITADGHASK